MMMRTNSNSGLIKKEVGGGNIGRLSSRCISTLQAGPLRIVRTLTSLG